MALLVTRRGSSRWRLLRGTRGMATIQIPQQELARSRVTAKIPGPRQWPLIGSLPAITKHKDFDPERIHLLWDSYFREYGPIFKLAYPRQAPRVCISHPADIERVLKATFDNPKKVFFDAWGAVRNVNKFFIKGQAGILYEQGEEWWRVRRLVQPHSTKPKNVTQYLPQMDQVAHDFLESWANMRDEKNELPPDFIHHIFKWAIESLGLVTFNKRLGFIEEADISQKIINYAQDILEGVQILEIGSSIRWWRFFRTQAFDKFAAAHDGVLHFVQEAVFEAQRSLESRDPDSVEDLTMVEKLLLTPELTFQDVHAFLIDFCIGGIDTTACSLAEVMLQLARNPEQQAKLQEELDEVLGNGTETLTVKHLAKLHYTKAALKEALRINSPVVFTLRRLDEDIELSGYKVPAGWDVYLHLHQSGMMEEFFPRPNEFLPERWLRSHPLGPIHPYASLPFGSGTRSCVGRRFSEQEIFTMLAKMFHKYRLEWKYGEVDYKMKLILLPNTPLRFTMTERH